MGKKRGKNGKHLFFHGACLLAILLLTGSCAATLNLPKKWHGHRRLELAEKLTIKGDYEGAIKENEEVAGLFPGVSPGDSALFNMGLIWAHPDNPQQDYENAFECFERLVRDFPRSALRGEARVWEGAINELIRYEGRIRELEEEVSSLTDRLNAMKEIDIGIEKKMREDPPER